MKIAVVSSPVAPLLPARVGGAQAFLCDLAAGLARRGHRVDLYCAEGSLVDEVETVPIPVEAGARSALVMPSANADPPPSPELARAFSTLFDKLRRRGADAVSQHAFDAEAIELAEGLPVIHTLHLPPLGTRVRRAALSSTARFATVSRACARAWAGVGVTTEVLPNGVPAFPAPARAPEPVALMAGRLSPEKGVEDGIEVARRLGLRPLVVGVPYDPGYAPDLTGATVLPPLPRRDLWRLMARCALNLQAVRWDEPFGMVAAEAQVAGCPVAGYARGGLLEIVEPGVSGCLAPPGDLGGLVEAARAAARLDRGRVRASALARVGLDRALDAYETALARLPG
jgi:glycosyltransferase involved in cell wall biosynthesis